MTLELELDLNQEVNEVFGNLAKSSALGSCDSAGEGHGEVGDPPGDPTSDPQTELSLDGLPSARAQWPSTSLVPSGREVQGKGQDPVYGGAGKVSPPAYPLQDHAALPSGLEHESGATESSAGQRLDGRGGAVELSEVGRRKPGSQDRREPKADAASRARPDPTDVRAGPAARRGAQIQRHPPDLGGEGGNIDFHAGDWATRQGGRGNMVWPGADHQSSSTPACWDASPPGEPAQGSLGQRGPETSARVLRLVLHDPSNHSYANAFVLTYLWCYSMLQVPEFQLFGANIQAWRDVLYSPPGPLTVLRLPAWRSLLKGWYKPASQHSIPTFMQHILTIMQPPILQVGWESRETSEAGLISTDRRSLWRPILVTITERCQSLQDSVTCWPAQAETRTRALSTALPLVLLQLDRRAQGNEADGDAEAVQHSPPMAIPSTITLPVFGPNEKCFKAVYHVVAVITPSATAASYQRHDLILRTKTDCARGSCWVTAADHQATYREALPTPTLQQGQILALIRSSLLQ